MRRIIVVTTKKIPVDFYDEELSKRIGAEELSKYVEEHLMIHQECADSCIEDYLSGYEQDNLPGTVRSFLDGQSLMPIFKRVLGDNQEYILYITLCISCNLLQGNLKAKHGFVAKLVELARRDAIIQGDDQVFIIAHDKDLGTEDIGYYDRKNCRGALAGVASDDIFCYQHKMGHMVYDDFICHLSDDDHDLLPKCENLFTGFFD